MPFLIALRRMLKKWIFSLLKIVKCRHFLIAYSRNFKKWIFLSRKNLIIIATHQLGPRYEGQLMSDGGAYSPFRSILLVLTHDFIIICVYGPTGSDGLRTIFVPFEAKGVLYAWWPVQPANGPPTRTTSG